MALALLAQERVVLVRPPEGSLRRGWLPLDRTALGVVALVALAALVTLAVRARRRDPNTPP